MKKQRYIPTDYELYIEDVELGVQIYVHPDRDSGIAYSGRRTKSDWNYIFRSHEQLVQYIADYYERLQKRAADKAKRKAEQAAIGRGLEVGDLVVATWGYEQTNRDFYQVTKLIGKTMVEVRPVASRSTPTGYMQSDLQPIKHQFIGAPMRKKARAGCVTIDSVRHASKGEWSHTYYQTSYH